MADYRDWCGSCGQETNFGGHSPDCDWLHAQRIAKKELRDFEDGLYKTYREISDEDLFAQFIELDEEVRALSRMLKGKEAKWEFIRRNILTSSNRKGVLEKFRETTGRRYI